MLDHSEHGVNCACWYVIGAFLWFAALFSLVMAWIAGTDGELLGLNQKHWFTDAIVLGILAIPLKLKGHGGGCGCGMCKPSRR